MEKTNVTNEAVSESAEKDNSKVSKDSLSQSPSGRGQDPSKELENKVRENLKSEYERKTKDLSEKLEEATERLAELEEEANLSRIEKAEKQKLENKVEGLEEEMFELDNNPKYRAYREKINRSTSQAKQEAIQEAKFEISLDLLEEFVESKSETEKMDVEGFRKELNKIIKADKKSFDHLLPHQRAKKAYKDWKNSNEFRKAMKELEEKKQKDNFTEREGRDVPPMTYKEAKDKGSSLVDRLKAVGQYSRK